MGPPKEVVVEEEGPSVGPPAVLSSRLCVKGIPKYFNEEKLREHFGLKGAVTDVKVMRTRDGKSRQFGFVGYASEEDAARALKYFDKSFLDASRVFVEFAYKYGESSAPRPWSKYSEGSSAAAAAKKRAEEEAKNKSGKKDKKKKKQKGKPEGINPEETDAKFAEFLEVTRPRSKARLWSNDDILPDSMTASKKAAPPANTAKGVVADASDDDDDDEYQDLTNRVRDGDDADVDGEEADEDSDEDADEDGEAPAPDAMVVDDGVSDMDYLRSRMQATKNVGSDSDEGSDDDSDDDDDDEDEDEDDDKAGKALEQASDSDEEVDADHSKRGKDDQDEGASAESTSEDEEDVEGSKQRGGEAGPRVVDAEEAEGAGSTGRLFIRNLPYTATEAELRVACEAYGPVQEVHVVLDKATGKSKGFAHVQFEVPKHAASAMEELDMSIFQGRLMHVLPGKRRLETKAERDAMEGEGGSSFKKAQDAKRKADAGNATVWNSLFMRTDTVTEAIAAHYGVTKAELLDRDASDMAARVALGEAHVIAQTKAALGDAGIDVDAIEEAASLAGKSGAGKKVKRSGTVLIVKNLPFCTSEDELAEMFAKVGAPPARLVLPPTHTLAVVEAMDSASARKAFRALAYKSYHGVPLYLEWAPANILADGLPSTTPKPEPRAAEPKAAQGAEPRQARAAEAKEDAKSAAAAARGVTDADADEAATLFVKNLDWETRDKALKKHFVAAAKAAGGSVRAARVSTREDAKRGTLSNGYGFVELSSTAVAAAVLEALQGSELDGHKLVLSVSAGEGGKKGDSGKKKKEKAESSKLIVRNVAFEATRTDIVALFAPFGQIKSARLPKKFDGTHRGFAFVDLLTKQEAKNAKEGVTGTHLYGRRLVIEYAKEDEGLEEIRARTAAKFHGTESGPARKKART